MWRHQTLSFTKIGKYVGMRLDWAIKRLHPCFRDQAERQESTEENTDVFDASLGLFYPPQKAEF